jgi:hypothetical protein
MGDTLGQETCPGVILGRLQCYALNPHTWGVDLSLFTPAIGTSIGFRAFVACSPDSDDNLRLIGQNVRTHEIVVDIGQQDDDPDIFRVNPDQRRGIP